MTTFAPALMLFVLFAPLASYAAGCAQPLELSGTDTPYSLWGRCLNFSKISLKSQLSLDSIVYFPAKGPGELSLTVDRAYLTQEFIADVFDASRAGVLENHQLTQRGVKLELSPTRLTITIYPSVVLRLRSDIPGNPNYRTFRGTPVFVVESVSGVAYAATDSRRVAEEFADVFIQHVMRFTETGTKALPDGRTQSIGSAVSNESLPPWRMPARVND
jgi:hypothetical protein